MFATIEPPFATKEVPFAYEFASLPKATLIANLAVSATTDVEFKLPVVVLLVILAPPRDTTELAAMICSTVTLLLKRPLSATTEFAVVKLPTAVFPITVRVVPT